MFYSTLCIFSRLAEKIRTARVNKERFLQKREREILVRKDKQYHQLYDQMMEKQRATALERERIYLEKKREDNLESRRVLEEQMQVLYCVPLKRIRAIDCLYLFSHHHNSKKRSEQHKKPCKIIFIAIPFLMWNTKYVTIHKCNCQSYFGIQIFNVFQEKADARKNAQLEYDREKALIDEVVRRIEEEDALETEIKRTKQAETKAFIAEFLEDREELRQEKIRKVTIACQVDL